MSPFLRNGYISIRKHFHLILSQSVSCSEVILACTKFHWIGLIQSMNVRRTETTHCMVAKLTDIMGLLQQNMGILLGKYPK